MRTGVSFTGGPDDQRRLKAIVADRNTKQKHVWRARIILESAHGHGTMEIMRRTGKSKNCVWRWQRRYMLEGVDGLLHDATRPPGRAPIPDPKVREVVAGQHGGGGATARAAADDHHVGVVTRKMFAFKKQNAPAFAGQHGGGGATARAAADDHHVGVEVRLMRDCHT